MKYLSCAAVQRRLQAYYDRELPADEQYAVEYHLDGCPMCHSDIGALGDLGAALRTMSAGQTAPAEFDGLAASVVGRFKAEREQSLAAVLVGRGVTEGDLVLALAAVVTQEGRVAYPELLSASEQDREAVLRLLNALAAARLEPASLRGAPVAVNLVWLLTHTTVRGKTLS